MKHILILFLTTLMLLSQPIIDSYTLPEDYNHLIYFLQKKLSKEHQRLYITSKKLDLVSLKSVMTKNSRSSFYIFVKENFSSNRLLQSLALYPHINIYLCQNIPKNMIVFKDSVIKSDYSFDKESLTTKDQLLNINLIHKAESLYLKKLRSTCNSY